jgi:cation diffusion facilitator family transporter
MEPVTTSAALPEKQRARAVGRVLFATLALNLLVAVAKIGYGTLAHSLSIRADGFHSLTDSANNLVGLVGVWLASRPADEGHPYGHHKFEIIAAGLVGLSLLGMAYDVASGALERLVRGHGVVPELDVWAFVVLLATLAVNSFVATWERRRGLELKSAMLLGDATHTRSDVLVTMGVLLTVLLVRWGYGGVDVVAALGIAAFIAYAGLTVLRTNLGYLADGAVLDPAPIEELACSVPGVASAHKVRTRGSPGRVYVDLHIQVAPKLDVVEAHRVTHWVIDAIKKRYPDVRDVLIHTEPARPEQPFKPLPQNTKGEAES